MSAPPGFANWTTTLRVISTDGLVGMMLLFIFLPRFLSGQICGVGPVSRRHRRGTADHQPDCPVVAHLVDGHGEAGRSTMAGRSGAHRALRRIHRPSLAGDCHSPADRSRRDPALWCHHRPTSTCRPRCCSRLNLLVGVLLFETLLQALVRRLDSQLPASRRRRHRADAGRRRSRGCIRVAVLIGVIVLIGEELGGERSRSGRQQRLGTG